MVVSGILVAEIEEQSFPNVKELKATGHLGGMSNKNDSIDPAKNLWQKTPAMPLLEVVNLHTLDDGRLVAPKIMLLTYPTASESFRWISLWCVRLHLLRD